MSSATDLQKSLDALKAMGGESQEAKPMEVELQELDKLYLDNMLLREQIANMQMQTTRQQFYTNLAKKYSIDTEIYSFTVDPSSKKILINPKS